MNSTLKENFKINMLNKSVAINDDKIYSTATNEHHGT